MDISLDDRARNPATGRYGIFKDPKTGDVSFDDTEAFAVMSSALCDRGGYYFDFQHGSDLFALRSLTSRTPSQAEAMVLDAEQPIVNARIIAQPTAAATADRRNGRLRIDLNWTTPTGSRPSTTIVL